MGYQDFFRNFDDYLISSKNLGGDRNMNNTVGSWQLNIWSRSEFWRPWAKRPNWVPQSPSQLRRITLCPTASWILATKLPMMVERKCPMWKGFATFGELNSTMILDGFFSVAKRPFQSHLYLPKSLVIPTLSNSCMNKFLGRSKAITWCPICITEGT